MHTSMAGTPNLLSELLFKLIEDEFDRLKPVGTSSQPDWNAAPAQVLGPLWLQVKLTEDMRFLAACPLLPLSVLAFLISGCGELTAGSQTLACLGIGKRLLTFPHSVRLISFSPVK